MEQGASHGQEREGGKTDMGFILFGASIWAQTESTGLLDFTRASPHGPGRGDSRIADIITMKRHERPVRQR
jgi:hypothetical protein